MALHPFVPDDPVLSAESIVDQLHASAKRGERHHQRARLLCQQIAEVIAELDQAVCRSRELKERFAGDRLD